MAPWESPCLVLEKRGVGKDCRSPTFPVKEAPPHASHASLPVSLTFYFSSTSSCLPACEFPFNRMSLSSGDMK